MIKPVVFEKLKYGDRFFEITNQGNGAYMGRLERMGYLISSEVGYRITNRGIQAIGAYENEKG